MKWLFGGQEKENPNKKIATIVFDLYCDPGIVNDLQSGDPKSWEDIKFSKYQHAYIVGSYKPLPPFLEPHQTFLFKAVPMIIEHQLPRIGIDWGRRLLAVLRNMIKDYKNAGCSFGSPLPSPYLVDNTNQERLISLTANLTLNFEPKQYFVDAETELHKNARNEPVVCYLLLYSILWSMSAVLWYMNAYNDSRRWDIAMMALIDVASHEWWNNYPQYDQYGFKNWLDWYTDDWLIKKSKLYDWNIEFLREGHLR